MLERRIVEIEYSTKFLKSAKKLSVSILQKAEEREKIFKANPFDPRLNTHKLHGKEREYWAYWINKKYRIKFLFLNGNKVLYINSGTHDEVY